MKYINKDDLVTYIQEVLLNSSIADPIGAADESILDKVEGRTIDLVKSYIGGRYDVELIFTDTPVREGVLVEIVCQVVIYRVVRRNAARKVPEDIAGLYSDALRQLEKIQSGSQHLPSLPKVTASDGAPVKLAYGNTTKKDFFI